MGIGFRSKAVILIGCLLATAALLDRAPSAGVKEAGEPLAAALARIPGWHLVRANPLDPAIRADLQLDDYSFAVFSDGRDQVALYVGLYRRAEKVGEAHHPLVCFSGQGWAISSLRREEVRLENGEEVAWATMTARREVEQEYVAYWFQAHDEANASPFRQKIALVRQKLLAGREDSAFIRISFPVRDRAAEECRRLAVAFLNAFYPVYLDYVRKEIR